MALGLTFSEQGDELPDSVLSELVEGRLAQLDCQTEGWVLTGYPRTSSQAAVCPPLSLHACELGLFSLSACAGAGIVFGRC